MEKNYFLIFNFFNSIPIKVLRYLFIVGFPFVIYLIAKEPFFVKLVAVYLLFLVNELFLGKLDKGKIKPDDESFPLTYEAFSLYNKKLNNCFSNLEKTPEVKFFNLKLGANLKLPNIDIDNKELLARANEQIRLMNFSYIIPFDFYTSYLLFLEEKSHFLKDNGIKPEDVITVAYWARHAFRIEEKNIKFRISGGAFDSLIYGWNYEVKKYARDFTSQIISNPFGYSIAGREQEYKRLILALSKTSSNSVIFVGEPGTGKTNLVEYFTFQSYLGNVPKEISQKKIYELFADRLIAGVSSQGQLEERLSLLFDDIAHGGNTLVFIQNIEIIFGGGGLNFDISGVLYEYLRNKNIQIIGTTTSGAYNTFIKNQTSITDLFEFINLEEPDSGNSMLMLIEHVLPIEKTYRVNITYPALKEILKLSSSYFPERSMPGKAIKLLEEAANRANLSGKKFLEEKDITDLVEEKAHVVLEEPSKEEKEVLLHLEDFLHKRVVGQNDAISGISNALRRLRGGFVNDKRPISSFLFLGPTGVGKTETAKALAEAYFGNQDKMIRLDMSEYQTQDQIKRLLGEASDEGYVAGTLVEEVRKNPFSLLLLDEFEKAHPHLLDIFLQVLDEGMLTDNRGEKVSFKDTIIIATSNGGSEILREKKVEKQHLIDYLMKNNIFKPELLNRFDEIVIFTPLLIEECREIAKLILTEELKKLEEHEIEVGFDEKVIEKIASESLDPEFGARNIRRYIEDTIENYVSKLILEEKVKEKKIFLSVDDNNQFVIT